MRQAGRPAIVSVVVFTASVRSAASAARRFSSARTAGVSPAPSKAVSWMPAWSPTLQVPPPKRISVTPAATIEPRASFEQKRPESRLSALRPSIVGGIRASRSGYAPFICSSAVGSHALAGSNDGPIAGAQAARSSPAPRARVSAMAGRRSTGDWASRIRMAQAYPEPVPPRCARSWRETGRSAAGSSESGADRRRRTRLNVTSIRILGPCRDRGSPDPQPLGCCAFGPRWARGHTPNATSSK